MKFVVSRLLCAGLAVTLAACSGSLIESKKIDYKSAGKAPSLEIPPDLTSPSRDDRFSVPDTVGKGSANFSTYSAERSSQGKAQQQSDVLPQVDKTRMERSGNQRWLVVAGSPDKVWGVVKDFWQETGFLIKTEVPEAGVMETDWAENRAKIGQDAIRNLLGKVLDSLYSTAERDKFRTRLEQGAESGTTDIFISHRGMYETFISEGKDQTRWQPRPADPDLEAEMLRRLMVRFGSDENALPQPLSHRRTSRRIEPNSRGGPMVWASSKCRSGLIVRGAVLALPWIGSVLRLKTVIVPRACISFVISIRKLITRKKKKVFFPS